MFSYEERIKAVQLLLQYDMSYASAMRELGYPARRTLVDWYEEYIKNGDLHRDFIKKPKFNEEERQKAVNYYLEHGKCVSRTVKALGYPSRPELDKWINEIASEQKKHCRSGGSLVKYTRKQKEQAVITLCSRSKPAKEVAIEVGVSREVLYNWKRRLINEGREQTMTKKNKVSNTSTDAKYEYQTTNDLLAEKEHLTKHIDELQKEVYRLQLERDILEKAAEIIKKRPGH